MICSILILWFALTFGSLIFVLWDQYTNTPSLRIMTLAWALIILYTGPLGLVIYILSCRQPAPGTHDAFINVHWKQAVGSLIHCVAGDATAIIVMAAILYFFNLPNGLEVSIEYWAAWLFGLFIFQALFMRSMFKSYWEAVNKTVFAETISMNMVMTGMFPVIVIIRHFFPIAGNPLTLYFWGLMSLATIAGSIVAYPINSWMVAKGIKHGMMSRHLDHGMMPHSKEYEHHPPMMDHHKEMVAPSLTIKWGLSLGTYLIFLITMAIVGLFVPITFIPPWAFHAY